MIEHNGHTFASSEDLGDVLAIIPKGKKIIIVREYGIENLCTAIDPSKYRFELVYKSNRKFLNLKQIKYINERRKAK